MAQDLDQGGSPLPFFLETQGPTLGPQRSYISGSAQAVITALQSSNPNFTQLHLASTSDDTILQTKGLRAHLEVLASQSTGFTIGPAKGAGTAIIGAAYQDQLVASFPCGIVGYGLINASGLGNAVFGGFFRADLNTTAGWPTGIETDCFNNTVDAVWPLQVGLPITQVNALGIQAVNAGTHASTIAFRAVDLIAPWLYSFYADPPANGSLGGIFIDATASLGTPNPATFKGTGQTANPILLLQTMGAAVAASPVIQHLPATGISSFQVNQGGSILSNQNTSLPAVPAGLNGINFYGVGIDGNNGSVLLDTYSVAGTFNSSVTLRAARGTGLTPTNLLTNDPIDTIGSKAFTNGTFAGQQGAQISFIFTDSSPNNGSAIIFNTTPNGSFTRGEAIRVLGAGNVQFTNTANFAANNARTVTVSNVGPAAIGATIVKWLTFLDSGGVVSYIPVWQ